MRRELFKFGVLLISLFVISGCVKNQPQSSQALQVTIISPLIKINDVGFLHKYKTNLNLQIYNSGVNIANIRADELICINNGCFERAQFNEKFFLSAHYERMFDDILQGREIYDGASLVRKECGFEQNISKFSIKYEVCGGLIKFNDMKNRIKIIIKELK